MAMTYRWPNSSGDGDVREGTHACAITDVRTVQIQVRSDEGGLRVVCPGNS